MQIDNHDAWPEACVHILATTKLDAKLRASRHWAAMLQTLPDEALERDRAGVEIGIPGRPTRPSLVNPAALASRKLSHPEGYAALLHALAHIELNAIDLAWDAVVRYAGLPAAWYRDWAAVAGEETTHFSLLRAHLQTLGYDYGDFDAHNGLWDMAIKTASDPLLRMAIVPRGLEARGLDVTPGLIRRIAAQGDETAVKILEKILHDEKGHVAAGSYWFAYLCQQRDLEPEQTFLTLSRQYLPGPPRTALNHSARREAGFSDRELQGLVSEEVVAP